ncbi:MAG: hypothetical protein JSW63_01615, partial [Ignavibacterium sp.]
MHNEILQYEKAEVYSNPILSASKIEKLTALWALSESALGGILHALRFPLRGMFISSVAIIIISMIARFSDKRWQIIKSTILVILIKALISPHTPLTAYLAVFLQGLLGELFFFTKKFKILSPLLLGIVVSLLNGFQKVIVLTLIFGMTLWETINDFINYIATDWFRLNIENPVDFSVILISIYVGIHLILGIIAGLLAYTIPNSVEKKIKETSTVTPFIERIENEEKFKKRKRRKWLRPSTISIFVLSVILILVSYLYPETSKFDVKAIIIMLVRAVLIMVIWFSVIGPWVTNYIRKHLSKKQNKYAKEISSFISFMPGLKILVASAWEASASLKGVKRIKL